MSIPGADGSTNEPTYGGQLQDRSILGVPAEGQIVITYEEAPGRYPDGTPYSLRQPVYSIEDLEFGPLHPSVQTSPRIAPAVIGMGLLEAISEARILALADPDDANGDGISGRPNFVWDVRRGMLALGRFGWKANQPTVEQQAAGAFLGDIGITSSLFPDENCPSSQGECLRVPNGGAPEILDSRLEKVTLYAQTLAVPAMRDPEDSEVTQEARLFVQSQCSVCHTPRHETGDTHPVAPLREQVISPYTDLLLHDMGPGLAYNRPDGQASGTEWRTPPLWGIGLVETVNGHTMFLHDGRARSIEEAILWHGGLLVLSPFPATSRRPTTELAAQRNDLVADLAQRVFIAHAAPGSKTEAFAHKLADTGKPLLTLDSLSNANLVEMGADVFDPARNLTELISHGA